ncbi:7672_t:CDS:1, partial [Racocetra fulgida]
ASANQGVPYTPDMENLVLAGAPQWNMARAKDHDSCAPDHAIINNGEQHPPATRYTWPTTDEGGCGDITYDNLATYYSKKWCDDDHFRVIYTLYIPKDGFSGSILGEEFGHDHDFESIVVSWKRITGTWYRDELIMSRHKGWDHKPWDEVLSFNSDGTEEGEGLEFPKIFVG